MATLCPVHLSTFQCSSVKQIPVASGRIILYCGDVLYQFAVKRLSLILMSFVLLWLLQASLVLLEGEILVYQCHLTF